MPGTRSCPSGSTLLSHDGRCCHPSSARATWQRPHGTIAHWSLGWQFSRPCAVPSDQYQRRAFSEQKSDVRERARGVIIELCWTALDRLMVGAEGFEPPTLCSQSRCATRLRYAPTSPSLSHRLRISPQIEPNKPCDPGPNNAWKSPSNTHVNRSNGSRTSAIRMMHRPPRKNQLCIVCFRGLSTLPTRRA